MCKNNSSCLLTAVRLRDNKQKLETFSRTSPVYERLGLWRRRSTSGTLSQPNKSDPLKESKARNFPIIPNYLPNVSTGSFCVWGGRPFVGSCWGLGILLRTSCSLSLGQQTALKNRSQRIQCALPLANMEPNVATLSRDGVYLGFFSGVPS